MEFALSREHELLRNMVRQFVDTDIAPRVLHLDEKGDFPFDLVKKSADLGLVGIFISKEYGGAAMGHLARMITIEEISKVFASLGFFFQTGHIGMYVLQEFGTEEQKRKYLPPLCKGEMIISIAVTEPTGGSDLSGHQTTAKLVGNEYILNGRKAYISLTEVADLACVLARMDDRMGAFLIEKGTPGFEVTRRESRLGLHALPVNEFVMTDCRIPKTNLIGQEGRGAAVVLSGIAAIGRTGAAGVGLGIARGCYEGALKFAKERNLYGNPIIQLQAVQFALVDMNVEIEAAKWLCYHASWLLDKGKSPRDASSEIAKAKLYTVDMANRVAVKATQVMGAYGLAPEYHVVRGLRDAMELLPAAGAQDVMRVTIGASIVR